MDWCWSWNSNILATWYEGLTHLKRLWCWERLRAGAKGDDRGWDGWMASPTQWTWVWVDSGSWWRTERPGMLQFMRSQRVRHDWATELNWKVKNYVLCGTLLRTLAWERQHLRLVWGTVPEKKDVGVCRHFCWRQMDMKSNIKRLLLVTHMHKTQALSS